MPTDLIPVVGTAIIKTKGHGSEVSPQEQAEQETFVDVWSSSDSSCSGLSRRCIVESLQDALSVFQDADMSILARPTEEYLEYSFQIFAEYRHFGHEAYTRGRCEVLKSLLSRTSVFSKYISFKKYLVLVICALDKHNNI